MKICEDFFGCPFLISVFNHASICYAFCQAPRHSAIQNTSRISCLRVSAIWIANSKEGLYSCFSNRTMVSLRTFVRSANCCCVSPFSTRYRLRSFLIIEGPLIILIGQKRNQNEGHRDAQADHCSLEHEDRFVIRAEFKRKNQCQKK